MNEGTSQSVLSYHPKEDPDLRQILSKLQSLILTSSGDFVPTDSEVMTGRKCDPDAISERGDDAAARRSRILGATTTKGFLHN